MKHISVKYSAVKYREKLSHLWREWLSPLAVGLLFTQFGASAVRVDGASMMPTLRHGEMLALPKMVGWAHRLGVGGYARGDIVVFKPPREAAAEWTNQYRGFRLPWHYRPYLVKRVVGVPGDTVQVREGALFINGRRVAEPHVLNYWNTYCHDLTSPLANTAPVSVPPGHYFVMGDNRSPGGSLDSRVFGPVNVQDIASAAPLSFWPLARQESAVPACDGGPQPEQRVKVSGQTEPNPRLLKSSDR